MISERALTAFFMLAMAMVCFGVASTLIDSLDANKRFKEQRAESIVTITVAVMGFVFSILALIC